MSDIVERLRDYAVSDHNRGCQGRCYVCECGYDDKRDPLLKEAAAEIERLRAALEAVNREMVIGGALGDLVDEVLGDGEIERLEELKRANDASAR